MRAWLVREIGDPQDVLALEETDPPVAGDGQVLVACELAPLNFPDDLLIRGQYQAKPPLPFTPGMEVLGRVVEAGSIEPGTRVLGLAALPHGGLAEMALIDEAIARGGIDQHRIGVLGGSYGGILTNWLLGHSDRFKAAITMRSCSNFVSMWGTDDISFNSNVHTFGTHIFEDPEQYWRLSPISYVNQIDTPLLIIHSEEDYRCPIEQAEQLFTTLKVLGRTVEFVRFPNESHGLSRTGNPKHRLERLEKITEWFGRWL
jgi:hypothetical protein